MQSIGEIASEGNARLGLGNKETSSFFISKDPSYLNNRGRIILGNDVRITKNFRILNNGIIRVGDFSYINPNSVIRIEKGLTIGEHCAISWNCTFMDTNHHKIAGEDIPEEIVIGNKVLIGANVTFLKGASIGDNSIVAAGSVVTKKFGNNTMIGGVPARVIKENIEWSV